MPRCGRCDQRRRSDLRRARRGAGERCWRHGWSAGSRRSCWICRAIALIDSAGLELLLDFQEKCQRMGGALKLANAGALCREVLKATGVGARFEIFRDSGGAVRSFVQ